VVLVPSEWLSQEYPVHTVEMEKDNHHTFLDINICRRPGGSLDDEVC